MASHDVAGAVKTRTFWPWLKSYPEGLDWYRSYEAAPVYTLLERAAEKYTDKVCTDFFGRTLTYRIIDRLVDETASGLQALGVERGSRVGLLLPNTPTYVVYYFAILKAG